MEVINLRKGGGGGHMKMSQIEILKDSVCDWPINMPVVSEKDQRQRGEMGQGGGLQRAYGTPVNIEVWRVISGTG